MNGSLTNGHALPDHIKFRDNDWDHALLNSFQIDDHRVYIFMESSGAQFEPGVSGRLAFPPHDQMIDKADPPRGLLDESQAALIGRGHHLTTTGCVAFLDEENKWRNSKPLVEQTARSDNLYNKLKALQENLNTSVAPREVTEVFIM
ncbi:MAG: hypothetical protein Q9159_001317 [Coniocarpon cinnabarinum]